MSPDRFEVMGVVVVVGGATPGELAQVLELFASWDRTFSRFRSESELSRVNATGSRLVALSPLFADVLAVALAAAESTDGLVDPTLGRARDGWRSLRLTGRLLGRAPGTVLDLNGVVKSLAVDAALELVSAAEAFVSAGGDVAARGVATVGLPGGDVLRLADGGLATSGTTHWQDHLIDPRTGETSTSRWTEVTVAASTCLAADVAAKAAFLLSDDGPGWLDLHGLAGRFRQNDRVVTNHAWSAAMERRPVAA
jgi:thiamine biosynthesis lipoprotein